MEKNTFQEQIRKIQKHRWIESKKVGYDVGEEWAAKDWVRKYAGKYRKGCDYEKHKLSNVYESWEGAVFTSTV